MIEASSSSQQIRRVYDLWSYGYDFVAGPFERAAEVAAVEMAAIQPHERVLEVAVGTGLALKDIACRVARDNLVCGVDLSPRMLARSRRRVERGGCKNVALIEANATRLPFADRSFDVLFNGYMLDLIRLADLPIVLGEFLRVLRPGGRLVLVNFSKPDAGQLTLWERFYQRLPRSWAAYLLGGCRPVVVQTMAEQTGFVEISRQFRPSLFLPTEIVTARRQPA
ncbi:MAG TPA: class I SAM-dependent methyltransferase [Pirellulales bacterium]|nr:class I SAM-dependent methyltransferase [Pirellulales bacterium]